MRKVWPALLLGFVMLDANAQLSTSTAMTPTQLVQNVLLGGGVTVSNVTIHGYSNAIGNFSLGSASTIGFQNGIVLTTGTVLANDPILGSGYGPQGPNNSFSNGKDNGYPGDALLASLTGGDIFNATVIEFDFIPAYDSIRFNYVFGSEEYPEWVCSQYNDIFGFFISGPNPAGGNYVNRNIALIPNTGLPVAINTINSGNIGSNGSFGGCTSLSYSNLYVSNGSGVLQYDAYTRKLPAKAAVRCGYTYHFKIAIADVGDGIYDSGVFIESNSFVSSNNIQITQQITMSGNNSSLNEGCGNAAITFTRPPQSTFVSDTIFLSYSGSAVLNTDYTVSANPSSYVIIPAGQASTTLNILANSDGLQEIQENIQIQVTGLINTCTSQTENLLIHINDVLPVTLLTTDTMVCPGTSLDMYAFASGGSNNDIQFEWHDLSGALVSANSQLTIPSVSNTYYIVTAQDECLSTAVSDTVYVHTVSENYMSAAYFDVLNNPVDIAASEKCDSVVLIMNRTGMSLSVQDTFYYSLTGSAQNGIDYTNLPLYLVFLPNETSKTIGLDIFDDGISEISETIIVNTLPVASNRCANPVFSDTLLIKDLKPLVVSTFDTVLCIGETITLSASATGGFGGYTYTWSNGLGAGQTHSYTASVPEVFTVQVQDDCGNTSLPDTCSVNIHYNDPWLADIPDDTACYERDYFFYVNAVNASLPVSYTFQTDLSQVHHSPTVSNGFIVGSVTMEETIIVQITDRCFKTASDTFSLAIKDCEIVLPTIITNNGDGINDILYFKNLEYYPYPKLIIFNRWGMKMYETSNYDNRYRPDYTDGTYYYILELQNGKKYPMYFLVTH
ncbi:MAG: hypothetical protein K0S33_2347 [Bacteroidetes bacterium]|jgi:hypothetical protein|nr:hypothetical protein [Bacteroidota bacterium]